MSGAFTILARSRLPVVTGEIMETVVMGRDPAEPDVLALVHRTPGTDADHALVRLHSACITGEVLGSAKCDCGPQLDAALAAIARSPWGVVVYLLRHEGRGIGLVNKIRAYALQDQGLDTVAANVALGFGADDRDFTPAVQALELLGVRRVALLTNNPAKAEALRAAGVDVVRRVPMEVPINDHNRRYLSTKRRYFGHLPLRDPVTELLTAEAATELFRMELEAVRQRHGGVSALAIRLDGYGALSEALGHDGADALVARVAGALRRCGDAASMARLGDDHFVWLLPDVGPEEVARLAGEVRAAVGPITAASVGAATRAPGAAPDGVVEAALAAVSRRDGID